MKQCLILSALVIPMVMLSACRQAAPVPTPGPKLGSEIGDLAPDFELPNLEGETVSLSSLGRPIILVFWHISCAICHEVLPELQELYQELGGEWSILTVSIDAGVITTGDYVERNNLSLPVVYDRSLVAVDKYGIWATPTIFFIDKDGIIQDKIVGPVSRQQLEESLAKILP